MNGPEVILEVIAGTGRAVAGGVSIDEPPGSFTNYRPGGTREVLVFGWHEGQRGVWRSIGGIDVANAAVREVVSFGFELLSDLSEPYEIDVSFGPDYPTSTVRFTAQEAQ